MGYTIVYARTFIKTTKGIIPLVLHGSNNCTEFVNGREVRERSWDIYHDKLCELPEDKFMETVHLSLIHIYRLPQCIGPFLFLQRGVWTLLTGTQQRVHILLIAA